MAKANCPINCGKRFISEEAASKHADIEHTDWRGKPHDKRKGWRTPYGFIDFLVPVTYEHACALSESASKRFEEILSEKAKQGTTP